MKTLVSIFPMEQLVIFTIVSIICIFFLIIYNIHLTKKITQLSQTLFSIQRSIDHKDTILENTISKIAKDLPIDHHPNTLQNKISQNIETVLHKFSVRLNKHIKDELELSQSCWHDKFSVLLTTLGKKESELIQARDHIFKDAWLSISELRQKSQLLFNDMKEDGIFYRMQSLWLLSTISTQQMNYKEALRHIIAAMKLYQESKPNLPLSHKLVWKLASNLIECTKKTDTHTIEIVLKKFGMTSAQILEICIELENFESDIEILQQIRLWNNHITN